ncbi:MAG: PDZ domain-containing protein [Planctomycetota bacterium]|jgi:hypothetical protein
MFRTILALAVLVAVSAVSSIAQEAPESEIKSPHGHFGGAFRKNLTVYQGGARDAEGNIVIQKNDRILSWNGNELNSRDELCRAIYATTPNELVEVGIERKAKDGKLEKLAVTIRMGDFAAALENLYKFKDKSTRSWDWTKNSTAATENSKLRRKLSSTIHSNKLDDPWQALLDAHSREVNVYDAFELSSSCELLLRDPLSSHSYLEEATDDLSRAFRFGDSGFTQLAAPLAKLMDRRVETFDPADMNLPEAATTKTGAMRWWGDTATALLTQLDSSKQAREQAGDRWPSIHNQIMDFEFEWKGQPGHDKCVDLIHELRQLPHEPANVLPKLDTVLTELEKFVQGFADANLNGSNAPKTTIDLSRVADGRVWAFSTPYGLIAVGDKGNTIWKGDIVPAVILDLGGNDTYIDCGVTGSDQPVSVIIDLAGDDFYRSTKKWGVASGVGGTSILIDRDGNDTYDASNWGIGTAYFGVGVLVDEKGNDRYLGGDNSIGTAAYGCAAVVDLAGNDDYVSDINSIGHGQPGGVGLVLDRKGDDTYRCGKMYGSSYGTKGEYQGWGIGCGFGYRSLASGGTGVVIDVKGNDIYDAGEFGLGCGYFLGIGMVRDRAGDDIYHSSRYGLAAGAHAAVGLFRDDGGDDVYEGKTAASIAGVWDIVTGYFYEGGGNDVYRCDGLGMGAAAQNAVGIFWDAWGNDFYAGKKTTLGSAGDAGYGCGRLARNFGVFIDGAGNDTYPEHRKNKQTLVKDEYSIFIDE